VPGVCRIEPPREVLMAARLAVLCLGALVLTLSSAAASDAVDAVDAMVEIDAAAAGAILPGSIRDRDPWQSNIDRRISAEMSQKNRDQLIVSFEVALERVQKMEECRDLFTDLGADPLATLSRVSFYPMGHREALPNMCRGVDAYTMVGGGPTWLCRDFWRLTDKRAAMIIIHEALHHAGLTEWPKDPDGMRSMAINRMVAEHCGL
jgi:hypothetical protein